MNPEITPRNGPTPYPASEADWPGRGPIKTYPFMTDNRKAFWKRREEDQGGIVLAGDSLIGGAKLSRLQEILPDALIVNRGVGGDTSRTLLFRFQEDVLDLHPKAIVILIGANDLSDRGEPDDTIANLSTMVAMARRQNPAVALIVCTNPPRNHPELPVRPLKQEELNHKLRGLANKGVGVADLHPLYQKADGMLDPRFYEPDQLHLSATAYELFCEELGRALKQTLAV